MLPQTFTLNLFDTTRAGRLTALLLLGVFALLGLGLGALLQLKGALGVVLALATLGGGGYAGWRAYKRAAIVPVQLTLTATALRLEDLRPEPSWSQTIRLADISTYRYSNFNNTEELRLNRPDAPPLKLRSAGALADNSGFGAMVAAFEQVLDAAPQPAGTSVRREKSFFEQPISTYLLVAFTLLLLALGWKVVGSGKPIRGSVFTVLGSYFAYVAAWRAAAARRNAP